MNEKLIIGFLVKKAIDSNWENQIRKNMGKPFTPTTSQNGGQESSYTPKTREERLRSNLLFNKDDLEDFEWRKSNPIKSYFRDWFISDDKNLQDYANTNDYLGYYQQKKKNTGQQVDTHLSNIFEKYNKEPSQRMTQFDQETREDYQNRQDNPVWSSSWDMLDFLDPTSYVGVTSSTQGNPVSRLWKKFTGQNTAQNYAESGDYQSFFNERAKNLGFEVDKGYTPKNTYQRSAYAIDSNDWQKPKTDIQNYLTSRGYKL